MEKVFCLPYLFGQKMKKDKGNEPSSTTTQKADKSSATDELKSTSYGVVPVPFGNSRCKVKVMSHESPINDNNTTEEAEIAYEGGDEHDENLSMKRDFSDLDLQAHIGTDSNEENAQSGSGKVNFCKENDQSVSGEVGFCKENDQIQCTSGKHAEEDFEMDRGGHVSDPGMGKVEFLPLPSPKLKRSCSNVETSETLKQIVNHLPPKSGSYEELQRLALVGNPSSPRSVTTHCSADKVMLRRRSSSQILPSGSRKLWWKLFLWSHRNLHAQQSTAKLETPVNELTFTFNQQGGYSSDTLEPNRFMEPGKVESSPGNNDNQSWDGFRSRVSGLWPQNQWVAFPLESPLTRVDEWVKKLEVQPPVHVNDDDENSGIIVYPSSPVRSSRRPDMNHPPDEILHANAVIHSLNSSSTVAHISGIGLKVIPAIAHLSSLRSVNLSSNSIVHVPPGSLPKGLHTLNLSRNKITTIEGLRNLTRLRVLDLSYNRISHIGQGLSNCTAIKELYLAGNKIGDVEGLHRLLKLTLLDLSFNKITTIKVLGQLVANYNSLLALNLVGNTIQINLNEDQLRKGICSLLPKLVYLNKQPINPQKAREMGTEGIAKAALGNSGRNARRRTVRSVTFSGAGASSGGRTRTSASTSASASASARLRSRSKSSETASSSYHR